jgi:DNA replication initiation complex subunit (GINS family)
LFINSTGECMSEFFKNKIGDKTNISIENITEEDNQIYRDLKNLWNDNQINIINNILIQVEKDKNNSKEWLESLDIILSSKEKCVNEIIVKNTTQLK